MKIREPLDKMKTLIKIMDKNIQENKKTLIFSTSDNTFTTSYITENNGIKISLKPEFNENKCSLLCGSSNTISKKIEKFNNGEKNILLLNTNHFGFGLNLEQTDEIIFFHKMERDMEKHALGRA